jgi:hypothetical protein
MIDVVTGIDDEEPTLHQMNGLWSVDELVRRTCPTWEQGYQVFLQVRETHTWAGLGLLHVSDGESTLLELAETGTCTLRMIRRGLKARWSPGVSLYRVWGGGVNLHWKNAKGWHSLLTRATQVRKTNARRYPRGTGTLDSLHDDELCLIMQMVANSIGSWSKMARTSQRLRKCSRTPAAHCLLSLSVIASPRAIRWAIENVPSVHTVMVVQPTDEVCRSLTGLKNPKALHLPRTTARNHRVASEQATGRVPHCTGS